MCVFECLEKALLSVECTLELIKLLLHPCTWLPLYVCRDRVQWLLLWLERESFLIFVHIASVDFPLCCSQLDMVAHLLVLVLVEDIVGYESPVPCDVVVFGYKISFLVAKVWQLIQVADCLVYMLQLFEAQIWRGNWDFTFIYPDYTLRVGAYQLNHSVLNESHILLGFIVILCLLSDRWQRRWK